ncbi:MAG TPA: anti-sigma factor RsbA family regulatory protein [Acidimicrobiales bacterium]|nr:anti-sigma factor RsbA family regulatory protein [Acidimicrobiales bacterium]
MKSIDTVARPGSPDSFVHEAFLYGSDDEALSVAVPFLRDAREHGEAAIVDVDDHKADLIRNELGQHADGVEFVGGRWYTNPASAIRQYLQCFESLLADGSRTIRKLAQLPPTAINGSWHAWKRYEAVINVAFAEHPVRGICLFDRATIPAEVVDDVLCTHPRLTTPPGPHAANERYTHPRDWLSQLPHPPLHDAERTAPLVELVDVLPHDARAAIAPLAVGLSDGDRDGLLTCASELVSNAILHGAPPVTIRAWRDHGSVIVTVDDCGSGIDDPFLGLIPPTRQMGAGGLGLWIAHQLCSDVAVMRTPDGFRVRIVGGGTGHGQTRSAAARQHGSWRGGP